MKKSKHFCHIFFGLIVSLTCLFSSCEDKNTLNGLTLDKVVLEMRIGETYILQVSTLPESAAVGTLEWTTSNPEVATVTAGVVITTGEGIATITVSTTGKSATCHVIVKGDELVNFSPGENVDNAIKQLPKSSKRGVSFGFSFEEDVALLAPAISWSYNWGNAPSDRFNTLFNQYGLDYFPMIWNGSFDSDKIRAYKAKNPQCEYLLTFNEPNLTDQANMTPQQAAEHWPRVKALADELNMKIVSPAMNYGTLANYGDPVKWLDEFFTLVPLSDVDAISIHCYMGSAGAMKSFIDLFRKYEKPIWMTEFCAWETHIGNISAQMGYMCDAINYMECDPVVERYAWFIPRASGPVDSYPYMQLLTKTDPFELSDLGRVFAGLSSMDKTVWQDTENHILVQNYSNICNSDSQNGTFVTGPLLRPTTDTSGDLEFYNFVSNQWVEYQIDATNDISKIRLRYSNYSNSTCVVFVDGIEVATIEFPRTGDTKIWDKVENTLNIPKGKHTVRLKILQGNICLNWLKFE